MILKIIENIVLGFAISAVPGAVFFETMRRTLTKGSTVIPFQVGNFSGMIIVASLALLGVSTALTNPTIAMLFYGLSGSLLLYIGTSALLSKPRHKTVKRGRFARSRYSSFLSGLTLAVANPLSIVFWVSLTGTFYQQSSEFLPTVVLVLSVVLGAFVLFASLIAVTIRMHNKIKSSHLIWITKTFGLIIATYGILTLVKLIELIIQ